MRCAATGDPAAALREKMGGRAVGVVRTVRRSRPLSLADPPGADADPAGVSLPLLVEVPGAAPTQGLLRLAGPAAPGPALAGDGHPVGRDQPAAWQRGSSSGSHPAAVQRVTVQVSRSATPACTRAVST